MLTVIKAAGRSAMPKGLIFLLIMIAFIIVYTIAKVVSYNRPSQKQWEPVDNSWD